MVMIQKHFAEENDLNDLTNARKQELLAQSACQMNLTALKEDAHNVKIERKSTQDALVEANRTMRETTKHIYTTKDAEKVAIRRMLDHEVEFTRFQKESSSLIAKLEKEINEKARALPVLYWVEKELKLNKGGDIDGKKKEDKEIAEETEDGATCWEKSNGV